MITNPVTPPSSHRHPISRVARVRLWDPATGGLIGPTVGLNGRPSKAFFNKDDSRIVAWNEAEVRVWDAATGATIGPPIEPRNLPRNRVLGMVLTQDEFRGLMWTVDGLYEWDVNTGEQIGEFPKHDCALNGALLFRGDTRIVSWCLDGTLRL